MANPNPTKLEAMMVHLLNEKGPTGKPWAAITVPGYPKFVREDAEEELRIARLQRCRPWWQFWKP